MDSQSGRKRSPFTTPLRAGDPKGAFFHVFDKLPGANRFLLSRNGPKNVIPDSDAPVGMDLWIQDENGEARLIAENVNRARFSPDGNNIAYTTSEQILHVENMKGEKLAQADHAYDPNWRPDSKAVAFAKGPEDKPVSFPETLALSVLDLESGKVNKLTDGTFDDVRPHFSPDGKTVLFVNGGRTGLASFWMIPAEGGEPRQVTNLGQQEVTADFVPTPYMRSMWTPDGRQFIYDFKSGEREETWVLSRDGKGNFVGSKLCDGIDPRLQDDGRTLTSLKHHDERIEVVEHALP